MLNKVLNELRLTVCAGLLRLILKVAPPPKYKSDREAMEAAMYAMIIVCGVEQIFVSLSREISKTSNLERNRE